MKKLIFMAITACNLWNLPLAGCQQCFDKLVFCAKVSDGINKKMAKETGWTDAENEKYGWGMKSAFIYAMKQINKIHPETNLSLQEWEDLLDSINMKDD